MSNELASKKCRPCERGTLPFTETEIVRHLMLVPDWYLIERQKIERKLKFRNFPEMIRFIGRMAALAEAEGHHPDFIAHYNRLTVTLWTHAVYGLTENDFILASKIDLLVREFGIF